MGTGRRQRWPLGRVAPIRSSQIQTGAGICGSQRLFVFGERGPNQRPSKPSEDLGTLLVGLIVLLQALLDFGVEPAVGGVRSGTWWLNAAMILSLGVMVDASG